MIIGLSGFARTGKDTVATLLAEEYGFERLAFADKLREFLYALNPVVSVQYATIQGRPFPTFLQNVIDEFGWDGYKETKYKDEVRRLLQRLGTEAGRQTLYDTVWIDSAFDGVTGDKIAVTDPRFYNEFDAIRERDGIIWRIERPGVGPLNNHASETEATDYPHFTATILNDGSIEDLREKVRFTYELTTTKGI